jgi:hypothetical protein
VGALGVEELAQLGKPSADGVVSGHCCRQTAVLAT